MAKRILALLICAVMLASSCVFANAATVSMSVSDKYTVKSGVAYAKYSVYGSQSGHTEACTVLEFSPNEYLAVPFVAYAGSASLLSEQYSRAVNAYGYEVAGVINGSYFSTSNDSLVGQVITNGRLLCAHSGDPKELVCFDKNGKMTVVNSTLKFNLNANGKVTAGGLAYVNKRQNAVWSGGTNYIFYYDSACGTKADTTGSNYEVLCKKIDNSEIGVGQILKGEVVSIRTAANASTIGADQFVLSVKTASDYATYLKDLKAGDSIEITVNESNASARTAMENAVGAITNVGWLVKNGVDQTLTQSTIGDHSVTGTYARWTAFGTKPDGSYVFFTSEGGSTGASSRSLTLRDVAAAMIKLGCNNVIRMDGGGSSAMYVSSKNGGSAGYVQNHSRPVCDAILIVKKSSLIDQNLITTLNNAINEAKAYVSMTSDAEVSAAISEAEAALKAGNVFPNEARNFIKKLSVSSKDGLKALMDNAMSLSYSGLTQEHLSAIHANYKKASEIYAKVNPTNAEIIAAYTALSQAISLSGKAVISVGKAYTTTGTKHDKYPDNASRLTDGKKSNPDGGSTEAYSGWGANTKAQITVNLGSSQKSDTYTVYGAYGFYGILSPKSMTVAVSNDGQSFTTVGTASTFTSLGNGNEMSDGTVKLYSFTVTAPEIKTAKYVRFTVDPQNFVWLDEVEVSVSQKSSLSVSTGKSYTISGEKHGTFGDNGAKLTDGVKSGLDGGSIEVYSGWANGVNAVVTVDLGSVQKSDTYTVYGAYGFYGINAPKSMTVAISNDGKNFTNIGSTTSLISLGNGNQVNDGVTNRYALKITSATMQSARYVRFTVTPTNFVWIDEIDVSISSTDKLQTVESAVDIDGFNGYINDGSCYIYTPDFGTLTTDKINHRYTCNVILTKTSDPNVYTIKSISTANGSAAAITLASNEIMIASHSGETSLSVISHTILKSASVGKKVTFYGVDFASKTICAAAYATVEGTDPIDPPVNPPVDPANGKLGDVNKDGKIDQYDYILVKRHYFKTRTLTGSEATRADANKDGKVDQFDYILIARHYFGTFVIK